MFKLLTITFDLKKNFYLCCTNDKKYIETVVFEI